MTNTTIERRRVAVRITKDALRQIRGGHPWVFDGSVTSVSHDGLPGDLAVIFDDDRRFAAVGLYDPSSPLRVRVLHTGKPVQIDDSWWQASFDRTVGRRAELIADPLTTAYRVIHGENDGWPGLVVDRYAGVAVIKVYSAAWLPHLATVAGLLTRRFDVDSIIVRFSREVKRGATLGLVDGSALHGVTPTEPIEFLENGLLFEADVVRGQKTGHFLDQRDNRAQIRRIAGGARVLDVFACTGGFSVAAAAGGASSVLSTDLAEAALQTAARNMERNGLSSVHATTTGDAFEVMASLAAAHRRFDVVVVDPPSFARKATEVTGALQAYRRLTQLALAVLEPGGTLAQSSCSSRVVAADFFEAVTAAAASAARPLRSVEHTGHTVDHPIGFAFGGYLKTIFAVA